jgi:hypothetical protein
MMTTLKTSGEKLHIGLTIALLAACAVNLMLVCAWLQVAALSGQGPP